MRKHIIFVRVTYEEPVSAWPTCPTSYERSWSVEAVGSTPNAEATEFVLTKLHAEHGLPEEAGADHWIEFFGKPIDGLTPEEAAIASNLDDPKYPHGPRTQAWLSPMVDSANAAIAAYHKHLTEVSGLRKSEPATPSGPPLPPLHSGLHELGNTMTTLEGLSRTAAELRAKHARARETAATPVTPSELQELLKAPLQASEPDALPPELLHAARDSIAQARGACTAIRDAVRAGGGNVLDAMTRPGDRARSVELLARIKDCETLLTKLDAGLSIPNAVLEGIAEEASACRDWCRSTLLDLEGSMELETVPRPARDHDDSDHIIDGLDRGYTAKELRQTAGKMSETKFAEIRSAAGIAGDHQHRCFSADEIRLLINAVIAGTTYRGKHKSFRDAATTAEKWQKLEKKLRGLGSA